MRRAIYPGSFDPPTRGHLDIISRGAALFDEVIVALLRNPGKNPMFSVEDRVAMLQAILAPLQDRVRVETFEGLLVDFARERRAQAIIRGVRSVKDYEYELPMVMMNRRLNPDVETILLVATGENAFISSSLIKEVFLLGGEIEGMVPDPVLAKMKEKRPPEGFSK